MLSRFMTYHANKASMMKARVDKPLGTRSHEVITKDGARYQRNVIRT